MKDRSSDIPRGTRTGFTTGACAAAAARAAVLGLTTGQVPAEVECLLPNSSRVRFAVHDGHCDATHAHAMVVKFAGDDPDCTDGAHLTVDLRLLHGRAGEVTFCAGEGVGTVTLPGLGLAVGGPAINPVPRQNIADNLREAAPALLAAHGLEVTVSVPGGQEMAKKTTNARLGILGGISILGTTGIVKPYSTAAWRASVVQGVQVAGTLGHGVVALTTGGRTETFAMATLRAERPELPSACFVQMGDFLRYALDEAVAQGIGLVVLVVMVGKLTKIAQGETITHAKRNVVDTELVARIARAIGASEDDCAAIAQAETARFGAELMVERSLGEAFHRALAQAAIDTLSAPERYGRAFQLRVLVCGFDGECLADVWSAPALPGARLRAHPLPPHDTE
ncbi:cobalt-precorrin-5B (C(1))-methyltransferase [Hydrogenophaga sp.]|uniref:cobalt-precorrin-5B (C(1))-methyltransferase n=1 Tax=Hydrogenophaga sp. TaxID=1904254 RepID=UPI00391AD349